MLSGLQPLGLIRRLRDQDAVGGGLLNFAVDSEAETIRAEILGRDKRRFVSPDERVPTIVLGGGLARQPVEKFMVKNNAANDDEAESPDDSA